MTPADLLTDAYGRVLEDVEAVLDGLDDAALTYRPSSGANPIAWLVWHLTRVQDDHLAELGGVEQRYTADGWADRFDLPYPADALGYGQSSEEVGAFRLQDPSLLTGYHAAVHEMTVSVVEGIDDFDRVVDERWDPPVTVAVRLVSVVNDITQHVGQAAYVKGLAVRTR